MKTFHIMSCYSPKNTIKEENMNITEDSCQWSVFVVDCHDLVDGHNEEEPRRHKKRSYVGLRAWTSTYQG